MNVTIIFPFLIMKVISKELFLYSTDFTVNFLEYYNRFKVEIFRVN